MNWPNLFFLDKKICLSDCRVFKQCLSFCSLYILSLNHWVRGFKIIVSKYYWIHEIFLSVSHGGRFMPLYLLTSFRYFGGKSDLSDIIISEITKTRHDDKTKSWTDDKFNRKYLLINNIICRDFQYRFVFLTFIKLSKNWIQITSFFTSIQKRGQLFLFPRDRRSRGIFL